MNKLYIRPAVFAALCALLSACGAFMPIGYKSPVAATLDGILYRDVHVLSIGKLEAPPVDYSPTLYAEIDGDIINAVNVYSSIPGSTRSLNQLAILRHQISTFKARDSIGSSAAFFRINAPLIDSCAAKIVSLEQNKLPQ